MLSKKNYQIEEEENIINNDEIIIIGNCDFNFIIIKDFRFYNNNEFNPYICNSDIIKLIIVDNKKYVISSDYEFKDENKIQKVEIKENENEYNQNWVINLQI